MAKIPCEIIRDLLPLYQDDICSEKSRNAIEEHIKECESCRTYLKKMEVPRLPGAFLLNTP